MNDLSPPPMGHNNPPDELARSAAILAPFSAYLDEAANWLDGMPVETEDQLEAVDLLLANVKAAEKALLQARDAATKPLHDAWKAEVAQWKAAADDLERLKKGLACISNDFKVRFAVSAVLPPPFGLPPDLRSTRSLKNERDFLHGHSEGGSHFGAGVASSAAGLAG